MACMTACVYMACMLLSPCCQDDYFMYHVILPVHHIHCLNSFYQLCLTLILSFTMSQGTCGQLGRNPGRNDPEGSELPPPPTFSQVLMEVERNRRDSHHLLEVIARNTNQQRNELVSLNDFIPRFSVTPLSPLTPMTGSAASKGSSKQDVLQLVTRSAMPPITLKVQLALG